jgi:hypothetical protein
MTAGMWRLLSVLCAEALVPCAFLPQHPAAMTVVGGIGVYIAEDLDGSDTYVGSVYLPGNRRGIASRIREHVLADTSGKGAQRWVRIHVLVLREDIDLPAVRHLEGVVGRAIHPSQNRRLPAGRGLRLSAASRADQRTGVARRPIARQGRGGREAGTSAPGRHR